jgi:hypothetical protein
LRDGEFDALGILWGGVISVPIVILGWAYGGLVSGIIAGMLIYVGMVLFGDFPPDMGLAIGLVIVAVGAGLQWSLWGTLFGVGVGSLSIWAILLLFGMFVGASMILALQVVFTRR